MSGVSPASRRFEVAFSFPGEHREFVEKVADLLAARFTQEKILYDEYHDAEFSRPNLKNYLPALYLDQSELVVIFLCPEYEGKKWCRLEWRHVGEMIETADQSRIMFLSFGKMGRIPDLGILEGDGKLDVTNKSADVIAEKIIKRLELNGRPVAGPAPVAALNPAGESPEKPFNLPGGYIGRLFLGRDDFLETIRRSLYGKTHAAAITQKHAATGISGLGGIGKTHAAIEYAERHRADYKALLFASADSPEKLQASLANLCGVLHLDDPANPVMDEAFRIRSALDWLATHPGWLLIIDNVDDESAAKAVTGLLGHLTAGHVLITSRLHGWADQVKNIDIEVLTPGASTELLLQLTADRRRIAADDVEQARQLADLLEGLPLAIHQSAGFINEQMLSLEAYHRRYEKESTELLGWFSHLGIPYERPEKLAPRPVWVTWKTSFERLTEDERFWMLVFSYFAPEPIPEF